MRDWVTALDEALIGKAKTWRDYVITLNPGKALYDAVISRESLLAVTLPAAQPTVPDKAQFHR